MFMIAPFQRFVALRYLRGVQGRSEGRGFLRFITYVAVGGVAVGVAALLLALFPEIALWLPHTMLE